MAVSAVKKEAVKPAAEADAPAPPKKKAFNLKLVLVLLCVIGAAGGGAYWYMNRHQGDAAAGAKVEPAKPPQFLPLDPFTVNLKVEESPQFLQVGLTLRVSDNAAVDALKLRMPEVRDRILLMLSVQKASVLLTIEGKRKLAADIVAALNAIVAPSSTPAAAPAVAAPKAAAAEAEKEPAADADAKPETDADAKPAAEGAAKPAAESADAPAAAAKPAAPVLSVLFTSFIVQ